MLDTPRVKIIYEKIQNKLFYMIPEKWNRLYLYASVFEQLEDFLAGEMYFYYFPKGILKKNPVNVYEIPSKFNIAEDAYSKHIEELYELIKKLWKEFKKENHRPWYTITISIENFKFKIAYHYTDVRNLPYSANQMHIIWTYQNLKTDLDLYSKKEKNLIQKYLAENIKEDVEVYDEAVYKNPVHNMIDYRKEETKEEKLVKPSNQILMKK